MLQKLKNLVVEEEGQGLTEYGLLLGGIAVVVVAAIVILRDKLQALFNSVTTSITVPADTTP